MNNEGVLLIKTFFKNSLPPFVRQLVTPRQLQALCVGAPKSGTTSIANLFSKNYRYEHEAERKAHVEFIWLHYTGVVSDAEYIQYLIKRDRRLWLDIESNCFLGYRPDLVYRAFQNARFILTIREPFSWLESIFDNNINYPVTASITMLRWHSFFFHPEDYQYTDKDAILKENKLYPLDAYLNYWVCTNRSVMDSIPDEQLLVLYTHKISHGLAELADYLGVSADTFNKEKARMNVTSIKHDIIKKMDSDYVHSRIEAVCQGFIRDYGLKEFY